MELSYLLFDATDDDSGACSFDAMASVMPSRLPAVLAEVSAVLAWAWREGGAPSAHGDGTGWDFDLQAADETRAPLAITFDGKEARVSLPPGFAGRVTITCTLSGPGAFGDAFRHSFSEAQ